MKNAKNGSRHAKVTTTRITRTDKIACSGFPFCKGCLSSGCSLQVTSAGMAHGSDAILF